MGSGGRNTECRVIQALYGDHTGVVQGLFRDSTLITENRMEKEMENELKLAF